MKTYKSKDVFLNVPGRGDIYVIDLKEGEDPPKTGEVINLDEKVVTVTSVDAHRGQRVGLLVRTTRLKDLVIPNVNTMVTWAAKDTNGRVYLFEAAWGHSMASALCIAEKAWDRNFVAVWHLETPKEQITRESA